MPTARDEALRNDGCRANVLHVAPSRAMLTDALVQYLIWKKWPRLFLIHGSHPEDVLLADAYRASATKFGAEIVEEREFADTGGARSTDTGHVQVQRQIPVFTEGAEEHDVIVAADEAEIFAAHLPYHTWDPRPITGSAGLRPVTWDPALEAWGATQFQEPVRTPRRAVDARGGLSGLAGDAGDRRGGDPNGLCRPGRPARLCAVGPVRAGGVQGPEGDLPDLERPVAPADPAAATGT